MWAITVLQDVALFPVLLHLLIPSPQLQLHWALRYSSSHWTCLYLRAFCTSYPICLGCFPPRFPSDQPPLLRGLCSELPNELYVTNLFNPATCLLALSMPPSLYRLSLLALPSCVSSTKAGMYVSSVCWCNPRSKAKASYMKLWPNATLLPEYPGLVLFLPTLV